MLLLFLLSISDVKKALKDESNFMEFDQAYQTVFQAMQTYAEDSRTYATTGARFLRNGNPEEAEKWFEKSRKDDRTDQESILIMAEAYAKAGIKEKADRHFHTALQLSKNRKEDGSLVKQAWAHASLDQKELAEKTMALAIEADPSDINNYMEWAAILMHFGDTETAAEKVQIALNEKTSKSILKKACQVLSGTYQSWYTIVPVGNLPRKNQLHRNHWTFGPLAKEVGLKASKELMEEDPKQENAARAGATALLMGDKVNGNAYLKTALESGEKDLLTHAIVANAYLAVGDKEQATSVLNQAFALIQGRPKIDESIMCGWLAAELHMAEKISHLEQAIEPRADSYQMVQVAGMYFEIGQTDKALKAVQNAVLLEKTEETVLDAALATMEGANRNAYVQ